MGKQATALKPANVATVAATVAIPAPTTTKYTVVPPKRPLTGTKFGAMGNAATHEALAKAATANGGTLTAAEAMAVCVAQNHKSFFGYAVNRLRILQPVVPGSTLAVGPL